MQTGFFWFTLESKWIERGHQSCHMDIQTYLCLFLYSVSPTCPTNKTILGWYLQSTTYLLGGLIENSKPTTHKNRENSYISIHIIFFLERLSGLL